MSVPQSVATILRDHVTLEVESLLYRLLHHATVVVTDGESFRMATKSPHPRDGRSAHR